MMLSDVDAFRAAWERAQAVPVAAKPDAAHLRALSLLAVGIRKQLGAGPVSAARVEAAVKPYFLAVRKEENFPTDPSFLQADAIRFGGRTLISVSMGTATARFAYDGAGRAQSLPTLLAWTPLFAGHFRLVNGIVLIDEQTIQDAGIRYGYRVAGLRPTAGGFALAWQTRGNWTLDSDHLSLKGDTLTIKSQDDPRTFSLAVLGRWFVRTESLTLCSRGTGKRATTLSDLDLRALDRYLVGHPKVQMGRITDVRRTNRELTISCEEGERYRIRLGGTASRPTILSVRKIA